MSRSRTILVTAFDPFGGETVNASWEVVRRLEGWRHGAFQVAVRKLPCVYGASVEDLMAAVEQLKPAAVLMTGQAARRSVIAVERFGHNVRGLATDNRGVALDEALPAGPARLETTASAGRIVRAIRAVGVPARASTDAGDFVCNHLYYGALSQLHDNAPDIPAVFLHLPATPKQTPPRGSPVRLPSEDAERALKAAIRAILASAGRSGDGLDRKQPRPLRVR